MEYFSNVKRINYEGPASKNPFSFRYYNPQEIVLGKPMKEHLPFAVAYWHTMTQTGSDAFGSDVNIRNWFGRTSMETAKNRVEAIF
jgi:xylose isomerase